MAATARQNLVWAPQPGPQAALVECPVKDIFYGGARGGGKMLAHDTPVLTPFGWKQHGELKPGDRLCATDGSVTEVIQVFPHKGKRVYEVELSDGTVIRSGAEHLWLGSKAGKQTKIAGIRGRHDQVFSTAEIKSWTDQGKKFRLAHYEPVVFNVTHKHPAQIEPYLLGVLIGDGCITSDRIKITSADADVVANCGLSDFSTYQQDGNAAIDYSLRGNERSDLVQDLKKLGLYGCRSETKFIPKQYLFGGIEQRWALLQGLMDTDGWAEEKRACYYASASKELAYDVAHLARSLGAICTINRKENSHLGAWTVRIKMPEPARCFRLERKKAVARTIQHQYVAKFVVAVRDTGVDEDMQCIRVRHANSLYIVGGFTVTHNTDGMLGKHLIKSLKYPGHVHGLFIRRELTQLENAIARAHEIYGRNGMGWTWHEQKKLYTSPDGCTLKFAYLDKDRDAEMYQGWSLTDLYTEELTHFGSPKPIDKLWGALRSAHGVPTQRHATGNPGGPGHNWVKERYVDPNPNGWEILKVKLPTGRTFDSIFIPSKVSDNPILLENDPYYVDNLHMAGTEEVVRAWLEGDWNVIEGAYFKNWSSQMVLDPFAIPEHWTRFRSFDWGSAKPFSCGWWAVAGEDYMHKGQLIPRGAMIRYRELYGAKSANVGLHWTAAQTGEAILAREAPNEKVNYSVADPAIFVEDGGPSLAERMGIGFYPADNKRVQGWNMMNERMRGQEMFHENSGEWRTYPMIYCFNTCVDSIRTIPTLQHDEKVIEDLDTEGEDHVADDWRYACMSRPWAATKTNKPKKRDRWAIALDGEAEDTWRTL